MVNKKILGMDIGGTNLRMGLVMKPCPCPAWSEALPGRYTGQIIRLKP